MCKKKKEKMNSVVSATLFAVTLLSTLFGKNARLERLKERCDV